MEFDKFSLVDFHDIDFIPRVNYNILRSSTKKERIYGRLLYRAQENIG